MIKLGKSLTFEQIKSLSEDEIIDLYRQGYRLEEVGYAQSLSSYATPAAHGTTKTVTVDNTGNYVTDYTYIDYNHPDTNYFRATNLLINQLIGHYNSDMSIWYNDQSIFFNNPNDYTNIEIYCNEPCNYDSLSISAVPSDIDLTTLTWNNQPNPQSFSTNTNRPNPVSPLSLVYGWNNIDISSILGVSHTYAINGYTLCDGCINIGGTLSFVTTPTTEVKAGFGGIEMILIIGLVIGSIYSSKKRRSTTIQR